MNDIVNKKDTNGLYQYIINNINDKNIRVLWKALREYTENGTYQEELYNKEMYSTPIFDLGIREEVANILNNIEDENICNMTDTSFNDMINTITDNILNDSEFNNELYNDVNYYYNRYFKEVD